MAFGDMLKNPIVAGGNRSGAKVMDFRSSPGLAAGLKRVGGRSGISRLGRSPIKLDRVATRISHKY